jgi:hypothetical protein
VVFNLDLSDEYNTNPNGAMFSGIPNRAKLSTSGSIYLTVYLAVAASFTAAWALMKRVAERTKRMEAQSIKEAARMAATRARSATAETERMRAGSRVNRAPADSISSATDEVTPLYVGLAPAAHNRITDVL